MKRLRSSKLHIKFTLRWSYFVKFLLVARCNTRGRKLHPAPSFAPAFSTRVTFICKNHFSFTCNVSFIFKRWKDKGNENQYLIIILTKVPVDTRAWVIFHIVLFLIQFNWFVPMREKNLWRSSILCKVAGHRPTTLSKVLLLHKYFSYILLKLIITLVISMIGSLVSNDFKVLFDVCMLSNLLKKQKHPSRGILQILFLFICD